MLVYPGCSGKRPLNWCTMCLRNVPPLAYYNFDKHEWNVNFFAEMLPIKYAIKRRFTMPPWITCGSALPGKTWKHENHIFHSSAVLVEIGAAVGLCCTHNAPVCCLRERKKSSVMCLIASNIWWGTKIILSIDFHSKLVEQQLPSFTQRPTPWQNWLTQNMWVTDSRMLCSLPRSCLVHPVDRFDSEAWLSCNQVIF